MIAIILVILSLLCYLIYCNGFISKPSTTALNSFLTMLLIINVGLLYLNARIYFMSDMELLQSNISSSILFIITFLRSFDILGMVCLCALIIFYILYNANKMLLSMDKSYKKNQTILKKNNPK